MTEYHFQISNYIIDTKCCSIEIINLYQISWIVLCQIHKKLGILALAQKSQSMKIVNYQTETRTLFGSHENCHAQLFFYIHAYSFSYLFEIRFLGASEFWVSHFWCNPQEVLIYISKSCFLFVSYLYVQSPSIILFEAY